MPKVTDSTETTPEADATTEAAAAKTPAKPKREVPEGHMTPVNYAKHLGEIEGREVKPQIVYGYVRNSKPFVEACVTTYEDGKSPGYTIDVAKADEFMKGLAEKRTAREAAKAAKAAADAAASKDEAKAS